MSKLIDFSSLKDLDFKKLGLKCGLEIHQQLNTGKLFCTCPSDIVVNDTLNKQIERKLRFFKGEDGEVDKAALNEFKKGKYNHYRFNDEVACLVDLDEEPPKGPNKLAMDTIYKMGSMFNIEFFDNLQFMRKLIVDGSIASGFQRTALIGVGGEVETSFGKVNIDAVNIEEDSSRVLERNADHTIFSLDRQGIPLIEITTGPQIYSSQQAYETAKYIGNVLRSFKETRRGLGSIRQDLNVSITSGARVEIKGAQNLKLLAEVLENEVRRQIVHISILEELQERKIYVDNFTDWEVVNLSKCFEKCESKVIAQNVKDKDFGVFGVRLFNFKGILGTEMQKDFRFATEVSDRNKSHFPQVKGLFHSDELPKYGISEDEVAAVRHQLKLKHEDSFILIANKSEIAQNSLRFVLEIIDGLILEIQSEVRQVDPKGVNTKFLRPMPGSARMYPETDIPKMAIGEKYLDEMSKNLPELYDSKIERLEKQWSIEDNKINEMLDSYSEEEVSALIKTSEKTANFVYSILFDIPKDIKKRDKIEPVNFKYSLLEELLSKLAKDEINQRTIRDIFVSLYKDNLDEVSSLKDYLDEKGLISEEVDSGEVEAKIKEIIEKNKGAPFGALMGLCMKTFGGSVDGKKISELLKKFS